LGGLVIIRHKVTQTTERGNNPLVCLELPHYPDEKSTGCAGIKLEIANTDKARELGLSNRGQLDDRKGMLFEFGAPQTACMWMKDMHFAIDMIWLNGNNTITKIERSVPPDSYPQAFCANNTSYVIELSAGAASRAELTVGKQLVL
jgi:hypothetical protein